MWGSLVSLSIIWWFCWLTVASSWLMSTTRFNRRLGWFFDRLSLTLDTLLKRPIVQLQEQKRKSSIWLTPSAQTLVHLKHRRSRRNEASSESEINNRRWKKGVKTHQQRTEMKKRGERGRWGGSRGDIGGGKEHHPGTTDCVFYTGTRTFLLFSQHVSFVPPQAKMLLVVWTWKTRDKRAQKEEKMHPWASWRGCRATGTFTHSDGWMLRRPLWQGPRWQRSEGALHIYHSVFASASCSAVLIEYELLPLCSLTCHIMGPLLSSYNI